MRLGSVIGQERQGHKRYGQEIGTCSEIGTEKTGIVR